MQNKQKPFLLEHKYDLSQRGDGVASLGYLLSMLCYLVVREVHSNTPPRPHWVDNLTRDLNWVGIQQRKTFIRYRACAASSQTRMA